MTGLFLSLALLCVLLILACFAVDVLVPMILGTRKATIPQRIASALVIAALIFMCGFIVSLSLWGP